MNLKAQRAAALKAAQSILDGAKSAGRAVTDEEMTQVEAHTAEVKSLGEQIVRVEKSQKSLSDLQGLFDGESDEVDTTAAKSLGEHFTKSIGSDRLNQIKGVKGASVSAPEFKAAGDTVATGGHLGPLGDLLVVTSPGLVTREPRELTPVSALLSQGTITVGNAIQYFIEGPLEGDVDFVAEDGAKPQLSIADPEAEIAALKKIAGWIRATDEYFEDLPLLASRINTRLIARLARAVERNTLVGTGTGSQLLGLLNTPGIGTLAAISGGVPLAEAVLDAQSIIESNTPEGFSADAVVMNRADYITLRKAKDGNDQYYGGGFFAGAYGNGQVVSNPTLWDGLKIVISPFIPAGTALVGAFEDSSTLYNKGGVRVDLTNSHADDFTHNRVTVRAERRLALATEIPAGYVKITVAP